MADDFQDAVDRVSELTEDPGGDVKLRLYGLFKQATEGDVQGKRPGFTNPIGRAKFDAWSANAGMSTDAAKAAYIEVVDGLT